VRARRLFPRRDFLVWLDDGVHLVKKSDSPLQMNVFGQRVREADVDAVVVSPHFAVWVISLLGIVTGEEGVLEDPEVPELRRDVAHPHSKYSPVLVMLTVHHVETYPLRMAELAPAHRHIGQLDCFGAGAFSWVLPNRKWYAAE